MKEENYNPYEAAIKSIAEMCKKYGSFSDDRANDFLDNVRVKCNEAIEYANNDGGEASGKQPAKDSGKDLCNTCSHYWTDFPLPLDHYEDHCDIVDEKGCNMKDVVPYPCLECPFGQYKEKPVGNKQ